MKNNPNPECFHCHGTGEITINDLIEPTGKALFPCAYCLPSVKPFPEYGLWGSAHDIASRLPSHFEMEIQAFENKNGIPLKMKLFDGVTNEIASDKVTEPIKSDQRKTSYNRGMMPPNIPNEHD